MEPRRAPRLTVTLGMHGSASTWVFNVVRELLASELGTGRVASGYAEDARQLLDGNGLEGKNIVLKCHRIGRSLSMILWLSRAPMFISIRDPRDAMLSMMQRFHLSFEEAISMLEKDIKHIVDYADSGHPIFRYEDRFTEDHSSIKSIAQTLGIPTKEERFRDIFSKYSARSVMEFGAHLADLPEDRLVRTPHDVFDKITHIHAAHIGDRRVGKWRDLLGREERETANRRFNFFLRHFGYDSARDPAMDDPLMQGRTNRSELPVDSRP